MFAERMDRVRKALAAADIDVALVSVGADLPWLTGYEAMPLERLTMLVLPAEGEATLVVPELEAPRVVDRPDVFTTYAWREGDDPLDLVARLVGPAPALAIGDRTWATFLVGLLDRMAPRRLVRTSEVIGPLRAVKDAPEVEALRRAAHAADRVAAALQAGSIQLLGRTEADVSDEIGRRLVAEGHRRVNFAIVASGPNAASPHHDAGPRRIAAGDLVLCDFGGTMFDDDGIGYCSDITRCVHLGEPPTDVFEAYSLLHQAQQAAVAAATVGTTCEAVDAAARTVIDAGGHGHHFIHRTGHGIGIEEHEDPYVVAGNATALKAGHAFSIEPGIYVPGRWGMRLEDIVVAAETGPDPLNRADHSLIVLDA